MVKGATRGLTICFVWVHFLVSHGAIYYASPSVPQSWCSCIQNASQPGDECRLHAGRYEVGTYTCEASGLHGTKDQPIIVSDAGDGDVIFDGTVEIAGPWKRTSDGRHFVAKSGGHDILQLFVNEEMQVLARFPNAHWSDKSMFYAVEYWLRSKAPGVHDVKTGEGLLRDNGACNGTSFKDQCCAYCNHNDLAKSGVKAGGSLGIMNLWSCDTAAQPITRQDSNDPAVLHYNASWTGMCDFYNKGDGRYYLEGAYDLLDDSEEWLFDKAEQGILLTSKPAGSVRGRVSTYALTISDASFLQISNISFHATTMQAVGDVSNINFTSLVFNYSSISKRSLGDISPPAALNIWNVGNSPANFLLEDIVIRYSDGPALLLRGTNTTMRDCLIEWNDWTGIGGSWPATVDKPKSGKLARGKTVDIWSTEGIIVEHNTWENNGAAQSINGAGGLHEAPQFSFNFFKKQLALHDDGAFVEGGGQTSTRYLSNWCTDSGKSGLRWDGGGKLDVEHGVMVGNVIWNTSHVVVGGNKHHISGNTIFDGADTTPSAPFHDRPRYQNHTSILDDFNTLDDHRAIHSIILGDSSSPSGPQNSETVLENNLLDSVIYGEKCPTGKTCHAPGIYHNNLIGTSDKFDIRSELRDPYHWDFRPCPQSLTAKKGVGAYKTYSSRDSNYWLPGRRERISASTPVPPSGSAGVHRDTELMFLPAVKARAHSIWLAEAGEELKQVAKLEGGVSNIARLPTLKPNTAYEWRVDTQSDAGVQSSALWTFTTGADFSCSSNAPEFFL